MEKTTYSYDDVTLIPQYSELRSRSHANTEVVYCSQKFPDRPFMVRSNPIMSANMESVTGVDMCKTLWEEGAVGVLHRFWSVSENVKAYREIRDAIRQGPDESADCFVSVGVGEAEKERASALYSNGARFFCIDIAHGHSVMMKEMAQHLRDSFGNDALIMAGNVATAKAVVDLYEWGVDIVKCGVGGGAVCTTRRVTGHGVPTFSCMLDCWSAFQDYMHRPMLIADGGLRCSGDMVKAFAAGADAVMLGSLLAGTDEAPGEIEVDQSGGFAKYKTYKGSSSYDRPGVTKEGVVIRVPHKGPVTPIVKELVGGIRSGMSYCNAGTLSEIWTKAKWTVQSHSGVVEGHPHGAL